MIKRRFFFYRHRACILLMVKDQIFYKAISTQLKLFRIPKVQFPKIYKMILSIGLMAPHSAYQHFTCSYNNCHCWLFHCKETFDQKCSNLAQKIWRCNNFGDEMFCCPWCRRLSYSGSQGSPIYGRSLYHSRSGQLPLQVLPHSICYRGSHPGL